MRTCETGEEDQYGRLFRLVKLNDTLLYIILDINTASSGDFIAGVHTALFRAIAGRDFPHQMTFIPRFCHELTFSSWPAEYLHNIDNPSEALLILIKLLIINHSIKK